MKEHDKVRQDTAVEGSPDIIVQDASGRRRFFRAGTAALMAGGAMLASRTSLAADCDRAATGQPGGKAPKQAVSGSDSDAGATADPAGCGRRRNDTPKISRADDPVSPGDRGPSVIRVRSS